MLRVATNNYNRCLATAAVGCCLRQGKALDLWRYRPHRLRQLPAEGAVAQVLPLEAHRDSAVGLVSATYLLPRALVFFHSIHVGYPHEYHRPSPAPA